MQAQRRRVRHRGARVHGGHALLVQPVAALVHRRQQRTRLERVVVPRRHAHVGRAGAAAERVGRDVLAPGLEVEAEVAQQPQRQLLLAPLVVRAGEEGRVGLRLVEHLLDERHQVGAQALEQRIELGHRHARLVRVEQRVVQVAAVGERLGVLDLEREHGLQLGLPDREVVRGARLLPRLVRRATPAGASARTRSAGSFTLRSRSCFARRTMRALGLGQLGAVGGQRLDRVAVGGVDRPLVRQRRQRGRVLRAGGAALPRAVRLLVPAEEPQRRREVLDLAHPCLERHPGFRCHVPAPRRLPAAG